jgi:hypothetical protein
MPIIYGMLKEEYERLKDKKQDYENKLRELPKGTLIREKINGHEYIYLSYRDGRSVKTDYIKGNNFDQIRNQLSHRKRILEALNSIKVDMCLIEKVVKNG